jgi:hypothetical protein
MEAAKTAAEQYFFVKLFIWFTFLDIASPAATFHGCRNRMVRPREMLGIICNKRLAIEGALSQKLGYETVVGRTRRPTLISQNSKPMPTVPRLY